MADVVMRKEDSDTLSVKELDAFLPQPSAAQGYYNEYYPHPGTDCEPLPRLSSTMSLDHVGSWGPVIIRLPSAPQDDDLLKKEPMEKLAVPYDGLQSPDIFAILPPSHIGYRRLLAPPLTPCPPYSPPAPGGYDYYESQRAIHADTLLFAEVGLHCYNLEKGTHFERLGLDMPQVVRLSTGLFTLDLEATDPVRSYTCKFETNVRLATENKDFFHVITTLSRTLPPPPPGEEGFHCGFDTLSVDELFKGNMPDWLPVDSKLQYYEMKESEVEQAKQWLLLYAELALYTKMKMFTFESSKPLELGKVVVQTRGVAESMEDVKLLDNAVFFITFKTSRRDVCKGIIRRTRDGIPEHLSLEAKCFM
ncbi:hypothetical protein N665_0830s0024 [Sinapis alba]|nr:hypothetical protein N665_0830s0024 [Sinapis alba]